MERGVQPADQRVYQRDHPVRRGEVRPGPGGQKPRSPALSSPRWASTINALVTDLTSITDENLTDGLTFNGRRSAASKSGPGTASSSPGGPPTSSTLIENCRYFSGDETVPFLSRYCDLQRYAQERMGLGTREQVGPLQSGGAAGAGPLRHGPPPGPGRQPDGPGHPAQGLRPPGPGPLCPGCATGNFTGGSPLRPPISAT